MNLNTAMNCQVVSLDSPRRKAAYTARLKDVMDAKLLTALQQQVNVVYRAGEPNLHVG